MSSTIEFNEQEFPCHTDFLSSKSDYGDFSDFRSTGQYFLQPLTIVQPIIPTPITCELQRVPTTTLEPKSVSMTDITITQCTF